MKPLLKESLRKSIHLSSLILPLSYRYLLGSNKRISFWVFLILAILAVMVDLLRLEQLHFKRYFMRWFGQILRRHEMAGFTGATFMMIAHLLCITIFSADTAFFAMSFLAIGDTFAAIVGLNLGKRKFKGMKKSLEGALGCFVSTFIFAMLYSNQINPAVGFFGALSATIAEVINIPVDDNFKIPLISGIVMTIADILIF
ncbi:MAG: phosphatidate cytidylyltransferase [Candidatus Cloacimonetes bacterium]|nr:phosphatidate cytidylyltransferase [Candidatus Cloacimonadota bacterium]